MIILLILYIKLVADRGRQTDQSADPTHLSQQRDDW